MSIANEIQRLNKAKEDIRKSIESKGVSVPSDASISDYFTYIDNIEAVGIMFERTNYDSTTFKVKCGYSGSTLSTTITRYETSIYDISGVTNPVTSVTVGDCVNTLNGDVFVGWRYLKGITFERVPPNNTSNTPLSGTSMCPIYVPADSVDEYKTDTVFSKYANRIVPIGWEYDYTQTEFRYSGDTGTTEFTHTNYNDILEQDVSTKSRTTLEKVYVANSVTEIGNGAFSGCSALRYIDFSDKSQLKTIKDNAFSGCTYLIRMDLPKTVKTIGNYAFFRCISLKSINIPNGITSIGNYAFSGCSRLETIEIPGSVSEIGEYAFGLCTSITSVHISDGVTSIGKGAFNSCRNIKSVNIPNSVTSIGNYAFNDCSSITNINIPYGVTRIGEATFQNCSSLETIEIPGSVSEIGYAAFAYCSGLKKIVMPNGVISIGHTVFGYCSGLTSVIIPATVTEIDETAFGLCTSLTSVTLLPTTPPSFGEEIFYGIDKNNLTIYVPAESVDEYKNTPNFSIYADRIEPINGLPLSSYLPLGMNLAIKKIAVAKNIPININGTVQLYGVKKPNTSSGIGDAIISFSKSGIYVNTQFASETTEDDKYTYYTFDSTYYPGGVAFARWNQEDIKPFYDYILLIEGGYE